MVYKKENTQKTIISKQQEKDIINNKQNQQKIRQKTTSYVIALILTIFGIIFLFSFLTTTNTNDNLKITGYVTGIPPSQCTSSPCDINQCGYLGRSNTTYVLAQDIDGQGIDKCFNITNHHVTLDCNGHSIINVNTGVYTGDSHYFLTKNCNIIAIASAISIFSAAYITIIDSNLITIGDNANSFFSRCH